MPYCPAALKLGRIYKTVEPVRGAIGGMADRAPALAAYQALVCVLPHKPNT